MVRKVAYIVAFNSKDQHSILYQRIKTFDTLVKILRKLWDRDDDFIVISLRIYKEVMSDG